MTYPGVRFLKRDGDSGRLTAYDYALTVVFYISKRNISTHKDNNSQMKPSNNLRPQDLVINTVVLKLHLIYHFFLSCWSFCVISFPMTQWQSKASVSVCLSAVFLSLKTTFLFSKWGPVQHSVRDAISHPRYSVINLGPISKCFRSANFRKLLIYWYINILDIQVW